MLGKLSKLCTGSDSLEGRVWVGGALAVLVVGVYIGIMGLPEQKILCPIMLIAGVLMLVIFRVFLWLDRKFPDNTSL